MTTMNHHDARGPEETVLDLPPVVPAGSASRRSATGLRQAGMPDGAAAEDAGELAQPEPGLRHRLAARPARGADQPPPEPLRLPAPLNQLPWDLAKDQFGAQGADFIGVMGALILRTAKDQFRPYLIDSTGLPGTLPPSAGKDQSRLRAY